MIPTSLQQLPGIGEQHAARIIRHLGDGSEKAAIDVIRSNPYRLLKVPRIGFMIADKVALFLGIHPDSWQRHDEGNRFILAEDGTLPIAEFDAQRQKLNLNCYEYRRRAVVEDAGRVWLPQVLEAEKAFADWVSGLPLNEHLSQDRAMPEDGIFGMDFPQSQAALEALYGPSRVICITGGAGTGKTRVIGGIAEVARQDERQVAVAAFAGKAADRIRESLAAAKTSVNYSGTIHRLLGYNGMSYTAGTLPYDVVVLDEASMIPTMLLWEVVQRLKAGARLILVGDPGQLPPVGYGQPFADMLTLGVARCHLEVNYRSAAVQGIINVANAIRGQRILKDFGDDSLEMQVSGDLSEAANAVLTEVGSLPPDDWQLITWKNDDATAFNLAIQEALNPGGFPLFSIRVYGQDRHWAEVRGGDKVMVKANDPDYGVFNGQLGVALDTRVVETVIVRKPDSLEDWAEADEGGEIKTTKQELCVRVRIGSEVVTIPHKEAAELLTLGWAITVHKAQGSDWEKVIIYQPGAVQFDAQRWWYTSITRAKSKCIVLYETKVKSNDPREAIKLWWLNTHRTTELGPSIFVGRVKKLLAQKLLPKPKVTQAYLEDLLL